MFKKNTQRWLSILLSLVLILQMVPAQAFALGANADTNASQAANSASEPAEIVAEIPEGRDEFQKEFLLSNGLRLISVYGNAVHYEEDGEWKEIDNTLQPVSATGTVLTGKAALTNAVAYKNTAGIWDVSLPTGLNTNTPVSVSRDGYTLSFRFSGALHNNHVVMSIGEDAAVASLADGPSAEVLGLSDTASAVQIGEMATPLQMSAAQLITAADSVAMDEILYKETALTKLNTALMYEDIYDNTDLRYDLTSHTLKESVIINAPSETLAGYSYALTTNGLVLELQDDNSILAYAADGEEGDEPIFIMPAPYLVDTERAYSDDITVSLSGSEGNYTLTYRLPRQWMAAEERVYPVTLDPVVQATSHTYTIEDQSVFQYNQFGYLWEYLEVGYDPGYGNERIFIKFTDLPELSSADVIVNAKMALYKRHSNNPVTMQAHEVLGSWSSSTINWSNMPATDPVVEDYQRVGAADWYYWNITDMVQNWYDTNNGVMLCISDVENGSSSNYHQFYSSDAYSNLPGLLITYLNNSGLEDYWDYTSQSAGRAGTGHVNNFTGNLVWVHNGLSFSGTRMPVTISHVYNANDNDYNNFGMGFGWRTNYNQQVYQWTENPGYYIWEDQDGTLRYFYHDSGSTYKNEIDDTLILKTNGSGDEKFCIEDKDGNKSYFDASGRLKKISNNQATKSNINIAYDGSSKRIVSVTDGASRVYAFTYSNGNLSRIEFKGTGSTSLSTLTYSYDGSSNLTGIAYPDGRSIAYGYAANHLLASATDVGGYKVTYEYNTTSTSEPNRVIKIKEYDGNTEGGYLNIKYAHNQTTFTDHNGNKEIVQFNYFGSTVSVQDGQGRAQFSQYKGEGNAKSASQLTLSSKLIGTPNSAIATDGPPNLVSNGDFQNGTTGWAKNSSCTSADGVVTESPSAAPQLNTSAYKITGNATAAKKVYQTISQSGSSGDVFTLAGWGKGDSVPLLDETGRKFGLAVKFIGSDGTEGKEHLVSFNPDCDSNNQWQYVATQIVADKAYSSIRVELLYCENQNTASFDGIQLYKEAFGQSYVYNDETGLVESVIDMNRRETTYQYESNQLTAIFEGDSSGKRIAEYEYDEYNNVTKAIAEDGTASHFVYDTYGNNVAVAVSKSDAQITLNATSLSVHSGGPVMAMFATYVSNGNLLSTIRDPLDNKTTYYDYNTQTGVLNSVQAPGETSDPPTVYSYDNLYRTNGVTQGSAAVTYTYETDLLDKITSASGTTYDFNYGVFDLVQSVKIDSRTLISHQYSDNANRYLTKSTYGNNDYISYTYDNLGRTTSKTYEDGDTVSYAYDIRGNLGTVTDSATGRTTKYSYDFQDRLSKYEETGSGYSNVVTWNYDTKNNLTSQTQVLNGTTYTTNYSYNSDTNRLTSSTQGSALTEYGYDDLGRMTGITEKNNGSQVVHTEIGYTSNADNANITSSQVSAWTNRVGGSQSSYSYTYDTRGNIATVSYGGKTTRYTYDALNQLTREDNQAAGKTWTYSYDSGGNITGKNEYAYTTGTLGSATSSISYTYGNSTWKDLLSTYNGKNLTYDGVGNLTNDGTWIYSWEHGRQLSTMLSLSLSAAVAYTYNADGLRTSKNDRTTTYNYHYVGDQLTEMTWGSNKMAFIYDAIGPSALIYNGTTYYYLRNAQGDVTGIATASGAQVVAYTYDAWGKLLSTSGSMATTLGTLNPLRYRGYVYDTETELYYLQSRYYNPSWGRFINADAYASTGQGIIGNNSFAYCGNNPIARIDETGQIWGITLGIMAIGGVIGAAIGAATSAITQYVLAGSVNWKSVGVSAATGFISGAIAASPLGLAGQRVAGAAIGGLSYFADCAVNDKKANAFELGMSVGLGVLSGQIGGAGANEHYKLTNLINSSQQVIAREARRSNTKYAAKAITSTVTYKSNTLSMAAWGTSMRFSAGCGISNGALTGFGQLKELISAAWDRR